MLLQIPRVVSQDKLTVIRAILASSQFVDGKLSAGMAAERVKNNEELASDAKEIQQLNNLVMGSVRGVTHQDRVSVLCPLPPGNDVW